MSFPKKTSEEQLVLRAILGREDYLGFSYAYSIGSETLHFVFIIHNLINKHNGGHRHLLIG